MPIIRTFCLCAAVLAAAILPQRAESQPMPKIAIGTGTAADFLPVFVARDKGIFAKHNLEANLVVMPTPSLVPPALVSGSVQIGVNTPPNLLLATEGGLDLVVLAGAARLKRSNPKISLVTRPSLTVARAEDLKGKKVGLPGYNSIIDMFLRKWLLNHKVALGDVSIVETPMIQMGDLLKGGQVDAVVPVEPMLSRIVASGAGTRSVDFFSEVNPDVLGTFWVATRAWAGANAPLVAAFRASLAESLAFIRDHPDEAQDIEKKDLGFADPAMPSFATTVAPADFEFFVTLGRELGMTHQTIDLETLVLK